MENKKDNKETKNKKKPPRKITVDPEILEPLSRRVQPNLDETEIRWWLTTIPETKNYMLKKVKKANRRINDIETELEYLEEQYNSKYIYSHNDETDGMGVTEKKGFAKNRFIRSSKYRALSNELNQLTELIEGYNIDVETLNDKSLSVRKLANFELKHILLD